MRRQQCLRTPRGLRFTGYLASTKDFRDVVAEIFSRHVGITNLAPVFPSYGLDEKKRLGIIA